MAEPQIQRLKDERARLDAHIRQLEIEEARAMECQCDRYTCIRCQRLQQLGAHDG